MLWRRGPDGSLYECGCPFYTMEPKCRTHSAAQQGVRELAQRLQKTTAVSRDYVFLSTWDPVSGEDRRRLLKADCGCKAGLRQRVPTGFYRCVSCGRPALVAEEDQMNELQEAAERAQALNASVDSWAQSPRGLARVVQQPGFMPPAERRGFSPLRFFRSVGTGLLDFLREVHWWAVSGLTETQAGSTYHVPFLGLLEVQGIIPTQRKEWRRDHSLMGGHWIGESTSGCVRVLLLDSPVRSEVQIPLYVWDNIPKKLLSTKADEEHRKTHVATAQDRGGLSIVNPKQ